MKDKLIKAIQIGDVELIKNILSLGLDLNFEMEDGWTPLMYAAVGGQLEILELLLKAGANINAQNHFGDTALIKAVLCNHFKIVQTLLVNNADISIVDNDGWTALSIAVARGSNEFIKILNQRKPRRNYFLPNEDKSAF